MRFTRRPALADFAALVVILVLVGVTATTLLPIPPDAPLTTQFTPEHVEILEMVDNRIPRRAHGVGLVALAIASAAGCVMLGRGQRTFAAPVVRGAGILGASVRAYAGGLVVLAATAFAAGPYRTSIYLRWGWAPPLIVWLLLTGPVPRWARLLRTRAVTVGAWTLLGCYLFFLSVPALTTTPFLPSERIALAEWHYSVSLAQGDRLAAGLSLGSEIQLNYGLIPQLLMAIYERSAGFLDFGGHIRVVQASQVAFLLVAVAAFILWTPRRPLFVILATMLVGPGLGTGHEAVLYPNQAGWRSMGFAVGILALLSIRGQPVRRAALILGACAAFLLLYNPETGLAVVFGYGLFLVSRQRGVRASDVGAIAARAAAGAVAVVVGVLVLYRAGLGSWPPARLEPLLFIFTRFGKGYGSLPMSFDPLAVAIAVHAAFEVARGSMRWWRSALTFEESVRLSVGATILIWSSYYVNRPAEWNLWTFQFLYLFLLAGVLEPQLLARQRWQRTGGGGAGLAVLVFVLVPRLLAANHAAYADSMRPQPPPVRTAAVSGVLMPEPVAGYLLRKAEFLSRQSPQQSLFLTRNSYSMSLLTGRFIRLPVQDLFTETITPGDFERHLQAILDLAPRTILLDAPEGGGDSATRFYDRLRTHLASHYAPVAVTAGWQVWEQRTR